MARPRLALDIAELRRLREEGLGAGKIAKILKCSKSSVLRALRPPTAGAVRIERGRPTFSGRAPAPKPGSVPLQNTVSDPRREAAARRNAEYERNRRRRDADQFFLSRVPYGAVSAQREQVAAEMHRVLDERSDLRADVIASAAVEKLRKLVSRARERKSWFDDLGAEFEKRFKKEAEHRAWLRFRGRAYLEESRFTDELVHVLPRARERFLQRLGRTATGADVDEPMNAAIDAAIAEVVGGAREEE